MGHEITLYYLYNFLWNCKHLKMKKNFKYLNAPPLHLVPYQPNAMLTFSKSASDLFLLAWATHFNASV